MKVEVLPAGFIINMQTSVEGNDKIESNLLLRALKINNTGDHPSEIQGITFELGSGGQMVKSIYYPREMVAKRGLELTELLGIFDRNPENELSTLGCIDFWEREAFVTGILQPQQQTGLFLEHFLLQHSEPIDEVWVKVHYRVQGREAILQEVIPVREYINRNEFIFPLKGRFLVINTPNTLYAHRLMGNQEFAIDVISLDNDLSFPLAGENIEYPVYGQAVYAVAEGRVVKVLDDYPENPRGGQLLPQQQMMELYRRLGYTAVVAGNYIVIQHPGGEFSFYAHLIPGSITVKVGDQVGQGDLIGLLGNSGNSDAPHLHFHLMDGEGPGSRGLPIGFTNLRNLFGETIQTIDQENYLILAD